MKKLIILGFIVISMALISGCSSPKNNTTEFVYMRDITDSIHARQLESTEVYQFYDIDTDPWNGGIFRFVNISDVSYNYTYEVCINPENDWLGNSLKRKKLVKDFYSRMSAIVKEVSIVKKGKKYSSIYIPFAHELNRLSKSPSLKKIIIINSDLMENSDVLSFYDSITFRRVKANPDSIIKLFESTVPLQRLDGIKIYLIYQPTDSLDDQRYRVLSDLYKKMLESKGAKVEIAANLITNIN